MDSAIVAALVRCRDLSGEQLRGVIGVVAGLAPELIVDLAERDDLDHDLRTVLLRAAPKYGVLRVLERWSPDPSLVEVAADAHGALPELVVLCGQRGWIDQAVDLAVRVEPYLAELVADRWRREIEPIVPPDLLTALVRAVLADRRPREGMAEMTEWERNRLMQQLREEEDARQSSVWRLVKPRPELWLQLASEDGDLGRDMRRVLLSCAESLSDEVLLACLSEVTAEYLRAPGNEFWAGVRMSCAAIHVKRWRRFREIAASELRRVVSDAVDDGWSTTSPYAPSWDQLAALAILSDDSSLLAAAVVAIRDTKPPAYVRQGGDDMQTWLGERAEAVEALAANPHTPRAELVALLPTLDEAGLGGILQHGDAEMQSACRTRIDELRRDAAAKKPVVIEVPPDDELAGLDDPTVELSKHLRHLRGRAAQRDVTCSGLLRSRYTTPDLLRALPAHRVLDSTEQADQVASMLANACGDNPNGWAALTKQADSLSRKVTFGTWLDSLTTMD